MSIIQCTPVYAGAVGRAIRHVIRHARPHRIGHHAHPFRKLAHAAISKPAIIGYTCIAVGGGGALGTLGGGWGEGWQSPGTGTGVGAGTGTGYESAGAAGPGTGWSLAGFDTEALAAAPLSSLTQGPVTYEVPLSHHDARPPIEALLPPLSGRSAAHGTEHVAAASGPESVPNHSSGDVGTVSGPVLESSHDTTPVPEPGSLSLLIVPLLAAFALVRRKAS
jgi:hypothetical protein